MGKEKEFYFNTHDLLMMAAFAAVGGIASSYINMLGDFFQSLLGFAGTTQWAAGLHILWLMMAAVIIRKPGAASLAGVLKGGVEFFSGNTHGLLVLIINIAAGLIIDLVFLLNNKKSTFNIWFYLAAGLSAVSNIVVFQIFASLPTEILTIVAIGIASISAFISGIIFGGVLVRSIILAVEKAGFYSQVPNENRQRKGFPVVIILLCIIGLVGISLVYLGNQTSVEEIYISGNLQNPYSLTENISDFEQITVTAEMNGIERDYQGYRLSEIIERAQPLDLISNLSIEASDGYSFFIPLDEVFTNENLILAEQKS